MGGFGEICPYLPIFQPGFACYTDLGLIGPFYTSHMAIRTDTRSHILTSSQVAGLLGVSKKTLDRMIKDGRIPEPNRKAGNNWRYWTLQDLDEIRTSLRGSDA
jgi:excisionase family DNA binding protein